MDVFPIAIIGAIACGLAMVLGGILLIYKGAMTLAATPAVDAITIEYKKQFRLNSQVPGIAFFVVGLMFVFVALWFCRPPPPPRPIDIEGKLAGDAGSVTIVLTSARWQLQSSSEHIAGRIVPDMTYLLMEANSPGCEPVQRPIDTRKVKGGKVELGELHFTKKVDGVVANPANISPLPFQAPPANTPGAYGVTK